MSLFGIDYILGGVIFFALLKYFYWVISGIFQAKIYFIDLAFDFTFFTLFSVFQKFNMQFKLNEYGIVISLLILEFLILPAVYFIFKRIYFRKLNFQSPLFYPFIDIILFIVTGVFMSFLFNALYIS